MQASQVAGASGAQGYPAENTLHVADVIEHIAGGFETPALAQGVDLVLSLGKRGAVTQRLVHPALEQARPHGGLGAVEYPGEGVLFLAIQGFG